MRQRHARRDRQRRIRHPAHVIKRRPVRLQRLPHALRHRRQHVRVAHDHAKIDVYRRHDPRFQFKLPKLHRFDLVQPRDERCASV